MIPSSMMTLEIRFIPSELQEQWLYLVTQDAQTVIGKNIAMCREVSWPENFFSFY